MIIVAMLTEADEDADGARVEHAAHAPWQDQAEAVCQGSADQ